MEKERQHILQHVEMRLRNPATMGIKGATMTGKTTLLMRLLRNRTNPHVFLHPEKNHKVLYCYGAKQDQFDALAQEDRDVTFHEGLPEQGFMELLPDGGIVVLDDLMAQSVNDQRVSDLFTKGAHHHQITIIVLEQTMFPQGKAARTQRVNTQYLFLFKNPADQLGPKTFANQAFDDIRKANFFEALHEATSQQYGYLMVDLHPLTPDAFRLRTDILPDEVGGQPAFTYFIDSNDEPSKWYDHLDDSTDDEQGQGQEQGQRED